MCVWFFYRSVLSHSFLARNIMYCLFCRSASLTFHSHSLFGSEVIVFFSPLHPRILCPLSLSLSLPLWRCIPPIWITMCTLILICVCVFCNQYKWMLCKFVRTLFHTLSLKIIYCHITCIYLNGDWALCIDGCVCVCEWANIRTIGHLCKYAQTGIVVVVVIVVSVAVDQLSEMMYWLFIDWSY